MSFTDPKCVECQNEYVDLHIKVIKGVLKIVGGKRRGKCDESCLSSIERRINRGIRACALNVWREKRICGIHFDDPRDDLVSECRTATNEQIEKVKQRIKEM